MPDTCGSDLRSTFSRVLADSDLHGARFAVASGESKFRRVIWSALIILSIAVLVTFCKSRLEYYYDYPYSSSMEMYQNWAPAPAVTVCPNNVRYMMLKQQDTFDDILTANDTDFFVYLYFILKDNIVLRPVDSNVNILVLNKEAIRQNESGHSLAKEWLSEVTSSWKLPMFLERIYNVSDNFTLDLDEYYPGFLRRYGVLPHHLKCTVYYGRVVVNCTEYLRQVFTSLGSCLVLDNINGSEISFKDQDVRGLGKRNSIEIEPRDDDLRWDLMLFVHDRKESAENLYQNYQYTFSYQNSEDNFLKITRVYTTHNLGPPYSSDRCSDQPRTPCIAECFAATNFCKYAFNYDREVIRNKSFCTSALLYAADLDDCTDVKTCPPSCNSTHYRVEVSKRESSYDGTLTIDVGVPHEVYTQQALYKWDSLLAEIGGMMGLFIGASVLTVCYFIEHIAFGIKNVLHRGLSHCRSGRSDEVKRASELGEAVGRSTPSALSTQD